MAPKCWTASFAAPAACRPSRLLPKTNIQLEGKLVILWLGVKCVYIVASWSLMRRDGSLLKDNYFSKKNHSDRPPMSFAFWPSKSTFGVIVFYIGKVDGRRGGAISSRRVAVYLFSTCFSLSDETKKKERGWAQLNTRKRQFTQDYPPSRRWISRGHHEDDCLMRGEYPIEK